MSTSPRSAFDQALLAPAVRTAMADGSPAALRAVASEVHPRVHRIELLAPGAAARLDAQLACAGVAGPPNSMHRYGAVLSGAPHDAVFRELVLRWVRPFAAALFPELGGAEIEGHHAFLVEYGRGADEDLALHVDDSEVTLNLCLAAEGASAPLVFHGLRCLSHRQTDTLPGEEHAEHHAPGVALLHAGPHRHAVEPAPEGWRRNLVVWCRSPGRPALREGPCPEWCGRY